MRHHGLTRAVIGGILLVACSGSSDPSRAADPPVASSAQPEAAAPQTAPTAPQAPGAPATLDVKAEYEKGAALAAAGKLAEARAVFDAAARQDPGEEAVAAAMASFRDLESGKVPGEVVQRVFRALEQS